MWQWQQRWGSVDAELPLLLRLVSGSSNWWRRSVGAFSSLLRLTFRPLSRALVDVAWIIICCGRSLCGTGERENASAGRRSWSWCSTAGVSKKSRLTREISERRSDPTYRPRRCIHRDILVVVVAAAAAADQALPRVTMRESGFNKFPSLLTQQQAAATNNIPAAVAGGGEGPDLSLQISPPSSSYNQQQQQASSCNGGQLVFLARSPHEGVHGFDLWKRPHDQRSGSCCSDSDSNVSSPAAASGMMRSRHEAAASSLGVAASTDLCLANPSSFDSSFQQASDHGVGPLVMSSSPEMQQMRAHGELFKPAGLHGRSSSSSSSYHHHHHHHQLQHQQSSPPHDFLQELHDGRAVMEHQQQQSKLLLLQRSGESALKSLHLGAAPRDDELLLPRTIYGKYSVESQASRSSNFSQTTGVETAAAAGGECRNQQQQLRLQQSTGVYDRPHHQQSPHSPPSFQQQSTSCSRLGLASFQSNYSNVFSRSCYNSESATTTTTQQQQQQQGFQDSRLQQQLQSARSGAGGGGEQSHHELYASSSSLHMHGGLQQSTATPRQTNVGSIVGTCSNSSILQETNNPAAALRAGGGGGGGGSRFMSSSKFPSKRSMRAPRMRWTTNLHQHFVHAVDLLGGHERNPLSLSLSWSSASASDAIPSLVFWRSKNRENPNRLPVEEKGCLRASCVCLSGLWRAYLRVCLLSCERPILSTEGSILLYLESFFGGNSRCLSWGTSWESTRRTTLCF